MNPVIPAPVPVPLPAPAWLLEFLLVFTFILHVVLMNLLLGGGILLLISSWLGRNNSRHRELARRAARVMPPVVAFTITLGVAPLLFLQLLYGQVFYTSAVLMAWAWLGLVFLVLFGYYGFYLFHLRYDELGPRAFWVVLVSAALFVCVSVIFTQNISLMQQPAKFYDVFMAGGVGNYVGAFDSATLARWLHFVVAALAVAGLGLALLARVWRSEAADFADWVRRYALRWFLIGTGVEFLVGLWFLTSLPGEIRSLFLGADRMATWLLIVAALFAVVAMAVARWSLLGATLSIAGAIVLMAVMRHIVRNAYLRPHLDPATLPVQGQWVVFALFVVLLLAGLATVAWMLYRFFRPASPAAVAK